MLLLVICVLILINSIITTGLFQVLVAANWRWLKEPRLAQPVLFLMPLVLLSIELWLGSLLSRLWTKPSADR